MPSRSRPESVSQTFEQDAPVCQGQRAHWVAMARWAASAMLIYFVIESSVSSG